MNDRSFLEANGVDVNKSLELFGNMETYNDTVGEFLVGSLEKVNLLKKYKEDKDMANYASYVHSLKSDAKYFGFTKLAELAYDQEIRSKANDVFYIYEHFDELMRETDRMVHVVRQYLGKEARLGGETPTNTVSNSSITNIDAAAENKVAAYTDKTILVVDDSNIIRNFVKKIFSDRYQVGTAKDGQEALDIIKANKDNENIVAILLDLNMPKVDGFKVLDFMQEEDLLSKMPVSIISGDNAKETIDKAFRYNIVDMLGKPFGEMDVKNVVEKTISFKGNL